MTQASLLVKVLKKTLRKKGVTYADVGKAIGLSESSVKRLFGQEDFTLSRMEQICALIGIEIDDLLELVHAAEERLTELTEAQERELVSDVRLLLVGILAISYWTFQEMLETYRFGAAELTGLLTRLDRLGVIELLPENRFKVRLARNFSWRKAGPIQRYFEQHVQREFFESTFLGPGELRLMLHGSISEHSNGIIQQHFRRIAEEFDALIEQDRRLSHDKREGTTVLMALRPWELGAFTGLRRKPETARARGVVGSVESSRQRRSQVRLTRK
jgi:DNA-binding Xre family transcriptional regulator